MSYLTAECGVLVCLVSKLQPLIIVLRETVATTMRDQELIGAAVNQATTPPVIGCQNVTSLILIIKTKCLVGRESHNFIELKTWASICD